MIIPVCNSDNPASLISESFEGLCQRLEHWETDRWAIYALLQKEILTNVVVDAGCGIGILSEAARSAGYTVIPVDVNDWGYTGTVLMDWLGNDHGELTEAVKSAVNGNTVIMNPPFSKAEKFVDRAFEWGARKVICFQRFPWFEGSDVKGKKRGTWWKNRMPARIYVCGDRSTCWLHSIPKEHREASAGTPTTHAFFVWESGHPGAALTSHIFKSELSGLSARWPTDCPKLEFVG